MAGKKIITLSFKIDEELHNRIELRIKEEQRSKSNFVTKVLTEYLDQIDIAKKMLNK